jgi:serine/threonine protein kinase
MGVVYLAHHRPLNRRVALKTLLPGRRPEDSLRFPALWLHEFGEIDATPNQIIAEGTDWRFLNELKRELKA